MKKRILALWVVAAVIVSMLPVNLVKADTAEDVNAAGADSRYTSVKASNEAAAEAQNESPEEVGNKINTMVADLLKKAFDREEYEQIWQLYETDPDQLQNYVGEDELNTLNQLQELVELADRAMASIEQIPPLVNASGYADFAAKVRSTETALNLYYSKYTELRRFSKYVNCLTRAQRDVLIDNLADYEKARLILDVEEAYDAVGGFKVMTEVVQEKIAVLAAAVEAAEESDFEISLDDFYNGDAIELLLEQYEKVTRFEEMLSIVPEIPSNNVEMAAALRAYDYYVEELTEEEREFIPEEYKIKLTNAIQVNTDCQDVIDAIDRIGAPKNDEDFPAYEARYEDAYMKYESFINNYSGVSGISDLITNVDVLNDATTVMEMIKSIRRLEESEDAAMCAQLIQMEGIRTTYQNMRPDLQAQIYNIGDFNVIYADAQAAQALRNKIDNLKTFTLEDETYIEGIRTEYDALDAKAKAYVGSSRYTVLTAAEAQIRALNQNAANRVMEKINAIGTVSLSSKSAIDSARSAYNVLSANQKKLVTNLSVLTTAENRYKELDSAASISKANVSGYKSKYAYTGKEIMPSVNVRMGTKQLKKNQDYTISYSSNKKRGTAVITLTGKGSYTGSLKLYFKIVKASVKKAKITGLKKTYRYTGRKITPKIKVKKSGVVLKKKRDYTISLKKNTSRGTASLTIRGKGNYKGKKKVSFRIV
ncbi:MAG: hypothetical protein J1F02_05535 [Lachnospiraceae bacterium]|nr:hypothetical protein [Lachnospiraceae bacterium]